MQTTIPLNNSVVIRNIDKPTETIILQEILIDDEMDLYPESELREATTVLEELRDLFVSLGFVVKSDGPKLALVERKTEGTVRTLEDANRIIASLPASFLERKSNELRLLLLGSGIAVGTALGGPLGLLLTSNASVGLAAAGIGAATGAGLGWTLSEAMKFWKKSD